MNSGEFFNATFPKHLLQITDTHLLGEAGRPYRGWLTRQSFESVCEAAFTANNYQSVLLTGDLSQDGSSDSYAYLQQYLSQWPVPMFALPGNHDKPTAMQQTLNCSGIVAMTSGVKTLELGDWTICFVNSCLSTCTGGRVQSEDIQSIAKLARERSHILLVVHHNPLPLDSAWQNTIRLINGVSVLNALQAATSSVLLCGHIHQELDVMYGKTRILGSPSTCRQFAVAQDEFTEDTLAPGYRTLTLQANGTIDTTVHRIEPRPEWKVPPQ